MYLKSKKEVGELSRTKEIEKKNPCFVCETKGRGGARKQPLQTKKKTKKANTSVSELSCLVDKCWKTATHGAQIRIYS
jgi:hypothetical protein